MSFKSASILHLYRIFVNGSSYYLWKQMIWCEQVVHHRSHSNRLFSFEVFPILISSLAIGCAGFSLFGLLFGSWFIQRSAGGSPSKCLLCLTLITVLISCKFVDRFSRMRSSFLPNRFSSSLVWCLGNHVNNKSTSREQFNDQKHSSRRFRFLILDCHWIVEFLPSKFIHLSICNV